MIYLDHAAATPLSDEALQAMRPYFQDYFANPSSIYEMARNARAGVDSARKIIGAIIGAEPFDKEIIFTSGGTEANNWIVNGMAESLKKKGNHIISTEIEHESILEPLKQMKLKGFDITYLPVNNKGLISPNDVEKSIRPETIFASIIYANNEIGTIQDIPSIAKIFRNHNIPLHIDACQAAGQININVQELGIDAMTLNSGKIYGPKGAGCLYIKKGLTVTPFFFGGGQEFRMRAGTENVPAIVGFATALEKAESVKGQESVRMKKLSTLLIRKLTGIPGIKLNGDPEKRLPNNVNLTIQGVSNETLLLQLDMKGIAASAGSACSSGSLDPSHVLLALGLTKEEAKSSLRLTLGRDNTEEEIEKAAIIIEESIRSLRE